MRFCGRDFFQLAESLLRESGPEDQARLRSATSRAYYAAFLEARDLAGIGSRSAEVHAATANHYLDSKLTAIGNRLKMLRRLRNQADYQTDVSHFRRDAGQALLLAAQVLDNLKRFGRDLH